MKIKIILLFVLSIFYSTSQTSFNLNWVGGGGSSLNEDLNATALDASGNIYITGRINGTVDFDFGPGSNLLSANAHCFIAKYSPTGALIWANVLSGSGASLGSAISVDATGAVYVGGSFNGSDVDFDPSPGSYTLAASGSDMFIMKLNSSGGFVWANGFGAASSSTYPFYMKVDPSGDIVVTGEFDGIVPFDPLVPTTTLTSNAFSYDFFVAKYNSAGNYLWAFNCGDNNSDRAYCLDIDATGNIYLSGEYQGITDFDPSAATATVSAVGQEDIFLAKYTPAGNFVWVSSIGGAVKDLGYRLKVNNAGEVIVSGAMQSVSVDADPGAGVFTVNKVGSGANDAFLGKYNGATGALIWAQATGGSGNTIAYSITNDQQNNIYLGGGFDGASDFDFSASSAMLTAANASSTDLFFAKYTNAGAYIAAKNIGGGNASGDNYYGVSIDGSNNIILTGTYANTLDFDLGAPTTTLNMYGGTDLFISKYSQCIFPTAPTLSVNFTNICAGNSVQLGVVSGSLNSATNWVWYTGACGGASVAAGSSVSFTPASGTDYYVRGEGGCITAGGVCASLSITVNSLKALTGQVTTNTASPVPVAGYVVLYEYLPMYTKFDSITSQTLDGSGNYNFTNLPSKSYIIQAVPSASNLQVTYAPSEENWKTALTVNHGCVANTVQNINVIPFANIGTGPGVLSGQIVEGIGYVPKGVTTPGNPIKGLIVKGGKNPGGEVFAGRFTNSSGQFTIGNVPLNNPGESYFIVVDIPGLDTNGTYHVVMTSGSNQYTNLDFNVDSAKINPTTFVGIKNNAQEIHKINVFPNPAIGRLNVSITNASPGSVSLVLLDLSGREVKMLVPETQVKQSNYTLVCPLQGISPGIYFLRTRIGEDEVTTKVIIAE